MSNIKTPEEIKAKLQECFLPKNIECDGGSCMGCWKDVVKEGINMLDNNHDSLLEENKRLRNILDEAKIQIEYLQIKFKETGSGNAVLSRIETALGKELPNV